MSFGEFLNPDFWCSRQFIFVSWKYISVALSSVCEMISEYVSACLSLTTILFEERERDPEHFSKDPNLSSITSSLVKMQSIPSDRTHGTLAKNHGKSLASLAKILP